MSYKLLTREQLVLSGNRVLLDEKGDEVAYIPFDEDAEFIEMAVNEHQRLMDRVRALDVKCALLAASLTKADAVGALMLTALLAVQPVLVGPVKREQVAAAIGAATEIY